MLNTTFPGVLTKHNHFYSENDVYVKFSIEYTSEGSVQSFMDSFDEKVAGSNIKPLFNNPIRWKKIDFDATEYEKSHMTIEFDSEILDGDLVGIMVSRKLKNGNDIFKYTLTFIKEVGHENEDSRFAKTYLKYKEEDENGKKKIKEFDVALSITPNTHSTANAPELF